MDARARQVCSRVKEVPPTSVSFIPSSSAEILPTRVRPVFLGISACIDGASLHLPPQAIGSGTHLYSVPRIWNARLGAQPGCENARQRRQSSHSERRRRPTVP